MKMNCFRKLFAIVVACIMVFTFSACGTSDSPGATDDGSPSAENQKLTLIIGSGHPSNTMSYTSVGQSFFQTEVAKRAAEEAGVDITWTEAYGGTVAGLTEALDATQNGLLQVRVGTFAFDTKKLLLMNMPYYLPFATSDPIIATKAFRKVIDQYPDVYEELWSRYNAKLIGLGPTGDYELFTKKKIDKASQLKGVKIGGAPTMLRWLEGTGAVTVQSNFNEAYTNLQTGVFDGYIVWPDASQGYKYNEQCQYMITSHFGAMAIQGISVNLDTWNSFSPELQKVFLEVGEEYEEKSAQAALDWDKEALEQMQAEGLEIVDLSKEEQVAWAGMIDNLPKQWIEEANADGFPGTELMTAYIAAMEELGVEMPRDWLSE